VEIIDDKALLLRLKNPAHVLASVPDSRRVDDHKVVVRWGVPQTQALRELGIKAPSPIERKYSWPGKFKPMSHQIETAAFFTMNKRAFCFSSQGTGKTASAIWAADYLMQQGIIKRVLVICPVSIMDAAWRNDLFSFAMHRKVDVAHGSAAKRRKIIQSDAEFIIINYDGVKIVLDDLMEGGFDLIIVDECFVAGTQVHTPDGAKPIESLKVGDFVFTSHGVAPIKTASSRIPRELVKVKLSNGKQIKCTPEHPFFTDWGWLPAHAIGGRQLIDLSDMPYLLGTVQSPHGGLETPPKGWHKHRHDLLSILRSEKVAPAASGGSSGAFSHRNAAKKEHCDTDRSAEIFEDAGPVVSDSQNQGAQTPGAGRQWDGNVPVRSSFGTLSSGGLGLELPSSVGETAARLSYELQARLRMAAKEGGFGSRRQFPQNKAGAGEGQEKDEQAKGTWVDSVSYCEQGDIEPVYNIEVDGTPNYFVGDGHLVHNCSAYQNAQTARWKTLQKLIGEDTWLWMMTGTPAAQGPDNAYGLAKLVNPRGVPRFFNAFRDMVMYKITNFKWGVKDTAHETVHRVLQPAIRFTKEECLDLPDLVYVRRDVPMTPQQKRFYERMRKDLLMEAAGEQVTAGTAAVAMTKLLQLSSGSLYTDDQNTLQFDISTRYKVLKEVLAETPHKTIVFVPFRNTIELLRDKLTEDNVTCEVISGGVPAAERSQIFKRFQETDNPHVLIIQPQSAAHGVTLTAADTIVWWGPTASLEIYEQANARIHRQGQKNKCTIVQMVGSPMERHVYDLLDNKVDLHRKVIDLYDKALD